MLPLSSYTAHMTGRKAGKPFLSNNILSTQVMNLELAGEGGATRWSACYCYLSANTKMKGPYSHFRVGAALLLADNTIHLGANVENAAYPSGTCAERVAGAMAVMAREGNPSNRPEFSEGNVEGKHRVSETVEWVALAVATDGDECASPCGMCRQL